jgi:4-carboxymuconolactone decarboxylase
MPRLGELTRELVYGDIWERPGLSKRDRSLITFAMLTAMYRTNQIRSHMRRALANGVTKDEIGEVLMHMAFYALRRLALCRQRFRGGQRGLRPGLASACPRPKYPGSIPTKLIGSKTDSVVLGIRKKSQ